MQIQVNSDHSVTVYDELIENVKSSVEDALKYFSDRVTRVEVHLSDVNAEKFGQGDKHCLIEARPTGHEPVAATGKAPDLDEAVQEAAHKVQRLLSHLFGRLDDQR